MKELGMKKKTILIIAICVVSALLLAPAAIILSGNQITVARCVITQNNAIYMVYDERPVGIGHDKQDKYKTGDLLVILHRSAFNETYPENTKASLIVKIGNGTQDDIPKKVFDALIATGNWEE